MVKTMNEMDLKLKLFTGVPIHVDGFGYVEPLTIKEIVDFGYSEYLKSLNLLCLDKKDLFGDNVIDGIDDISVLSILIQLGDEDIYSQLKKSLSFFFKAEVEIDKIKYCVYIKKDDDEKVLNDKNFNNVIEVIKWQNYIKHFEEKDISITSEDEKIKKFKNRLKEKQKKIKEIKKKRGEEEDGENNINFFDILSSISSKSYSINEINVKDLTIYQVYSKFKRLDELEKYDLNVKSLLAGAKDVKLKHWSSKVD